MNEQVQQIRAEIERRKIVYRSSENLQDAIRYDEITELLAFIDFLPEQPEVDLEKFTEKMDAWKARFNRPDDIPIKATMAFTARMFYMYPNVAREWYESLPKATQD